APDQPDPRPLRNRGTGALENGPAAKPDGKGVDGKHGGAHSSAGGNAKRGIWGGDPGGQRRAGPPLTPPAGARGMMLYRLLPSRLREGPGVGLLPYFPIPPAPEAACPRPAAPSFRAFRNRAAGSAARSRPPAGWALPATMRRRIEGPASRGN